MNVMESEQQNIERDTAPQHWRSCKLILDPALTNGLYKVYRYDGQCFNIPVQDLGVFPVETVRDPRICRLWSKCGRAELMVPKFKIDECYVGPIPPKEVTFARLNDNVREEFLNDMCKKYGEIDQVEIFYNPKNKKHLGIGKVIFDTVKAARDTVQHLHDTSVMGNIVHVEIDPKGENRMRYLQLLLSGLYTPWTLPVGSNEQTLQSLVDNLPGSKPIHRQGAISSPSSIATPLSLDTAYSSIWQDTPGSFGLTPHSQGTPRTPCLSGTPLSQDSCYSSLQATPVLQGEPSTYSVHKPSRREVGYRKPARHYGRFRKSSDFSSIFRHLQPQPLLPLPTQTTATGNSQTPALWGQNAQTAACYNTEPSFHLPLPGQESRSPGSIEIATTSMASPLDCNSATVLSINVTVERQAAASSSSPDYHSYITELPPSPVDTSPGSPHPETESLDSRIEMLLKKNQNSDISYTDGRYLLDSVPPQDGPDSPSLAKYSLTSDFSHDCSQTIGGPTTTSQQPSPNVLVDVSPTPLSDNEEDETVQAVASLLLNTQSVGVNANQPPSDKDQKRLHSLTFPKGLHVPNEDKERFSNKESGGLTSKETSSSLTQPPPFASFSGTLQRLPSKPPLAVPGHARLPAAAFAIPTASIPPSIPPFPVRLPSGPIPFPPPGWILPPDHHTSIPRPPPPIPPPPALLGPPPPLIAPPSVVHPAHPYPLHLRPAEELNKEAPPRHGSAPLLVCGPPWPNLPLPRFNPFVPPPGYVPVRENPHKVTVEKVLGVIMEELKSVVKKDITRKMVEGDAFKAFDEWWDLQEHKAKIAAAPLKAGVVRVEERVKPVNPLSQITGQRKITQLPSFKVKRKRVHDPTTSEDQENIISSAYQNDRLENDVGNDNRHTSDKAKPVGGGCPALKRRHARPLQLDSDVDEEEEEDNTLKDEEIRSDKEDKSVAGDDEVQCDVDDQVDDDADEEAQKQVHMDDEDVIISRTTDGVQLSDSESLSEAAHHCSSEESEYSSDVDSLDSYSSESTEDSSYRDLSSEEDEDTEGYTEEDRWDECIVISSDEELMELEPPVTPSAPLTPGAQLELALQEWSEGGFAVDPGEERYTACLPDNIVLDPVMEFQTSQPQDPLQPPSPIGLPVLELYFDVEQESPEWRAESPENIENLRPLTPTGSLVDSDSDLLIRSKPTPPAVEEVERPHTPGQGVVALLESEDSMDEALSLSPASPESVLPPRALQASYPAYHDMPKTPGTEERGGWTPHNSARAPATPGRGTPLSEESIVLSPPLSSPLPVPSVPGNPYIRTPQTPGRDILIPRRNTVHRRKMPMAKASQGRHTVSPQRCDEFLRGSTVTGSSPCSLSESSAATPDEKGAWLSSGARTKPLQGLENMPGLLDEENGRVTQKTSLRREQWRWNRMRRRRRRRRMRQWQRQRSLNRAAASPSSPRRPHMCRSRCEEMRILHSVWKRGLDEEDARLLQVTYERLLQQDNGLGWLSDTLWISHPLTRISTEMSEEHDTWQQGHVTGSARSEGFYKISRRDKLKYLNNTRPATELPSTSTQGMCIPAQLLTSLRSGSDFKSEQRRLLSSFSCDSDLVRFNQLKFRKKRIRFCRSHIHDWGLFAMEPIAADEMVIEYVGQTIRQLIADMREKRYEDEGIGSSYLFRVDQDTIIDATKCGNLARFINHSCNPNCYAKIITVESQKKIVIYSRQPISINEEITYDYKFPIEDEKIPCLCGADSCRGTLN